MSVSRKNVLIKGKRIILRKIKTSDVRSRYRGWMNDSEVNRFLESRFTKWNIAKLKDYVKLINKNPAYLFLAIICKDSNEHIGNIKLGPIHPVHKYADIGITIGEKKFWGKGFASEAISALADYSFNKLCLHKLTAGAYCANRGSVKAFQNAGFIVEGKRKSHFMAYGKYMDEILLGKVKKE